MTLKRFVCGVAVLLAVVSTVSAANPEVTKVLDQVAAQVDASDQAEANVKTFIKETLLPLCNNPVFVQAVEQQNAKGLTLEQIQTIDQEWMDAEDELPIQAELTSNPCAEEIARIAKEHPAIGETFVIDAQGANVGQNDLTSDYWQGDEPKWENSYNGAQGGVDIGKNKLDKSSNQVMQQVSLPVINDEGKVIGAVSYGIIVSNL